MSITVYNWRFEDGKTSPNPDSRWALPPEPRGWYCWVYAKDDARDFEKWLKDSVKQHYELTYRWNNGAPMCSVFLSDDQDAVMFSLTWL